MAGTLVKELGLSGSVLAGSAAANFGGRSTYSGGRDFFIAETCEYRRNFLDFHPRWMIVTSVEVDHLDYFKDYRDILSAFVEYGLQIAEGGSLIFCADDPGACEAAGQILTKRPDIWGLPYGTQADGPYRISEVEKRPGATRFRLDGFSSAFEVKIPGLHSVLNSAAAIALVCAIREDIRKAKGEYSSSCADRVEGDLVRALAAFRGSKRRSETLGEARGILFVDDYAHHPTAILTTLRGFRDFYPDRRLVVDFMSHTYSRTRALFAEFSRSFECADLLILHKIYASARESNETSLSGRDLFDAARRNHPHVEYFEEVLDAAPFLRAELRRGDLFITLGAGDNWQLGRLLYDEMKGTIP
jgi:UDP-N-acetylmuramate--alanine ligase